MNRTLNSILIGGLLGLMAAVTLVPGVAGAEGMMGHPPIEQTTVPSTATTPTTGKQPCSCATPTTAAPAPITTAPCPKPPQTTTPATPAKPGTITQPTPTPLNTVPTTATPAPATTTKAVTPAAPVTPAVAPVTTTPTATSLPFTGANYPLLVILGVSAIAIGWLLTLRRKPAVLEIESDDNA